MELAWGFLALPMGCRLKCSLVGDGPVVKSTQLMDELIEMAESLFSDALNVMAGLACSAPCVLA